jgi:hypothetical protein
MLTRERILEISSVHPLAEPIESTKEFQELCTLALKGLDRIERAENTDLHNRTKEELIDMLMLAWDVDTDNQKYIAAAQGLVLALTAIKDSQDEWASDLASNSVAAYHAETEGGE